MKKIDKELENYYNTINYEEFDDITLQKLKKLVDKNKQRKPHILKKLAIGLSCVIIVLSISLFTIFNLKNDNHSIYFTDDEAEKIVLSKDDAENYIETNFPKYVFLFNDYTFNGANLYYIPNTKEELAVYLEVTENNIPFTIIKLLLVVNSKFVFSKKNSYTDNATIEINENYTIYIKEIIEQYDEELLSYIKFENYELFITFSPINKELLNKFL